MEQPTHTFQVFKAFDYDQDGFPDVDELKRAFRAMGLQKRSGEKLEVDEAMFKSFDTNGDGKVSLEEFQANLFDKTRAKIEEKLNAGWTFDAAAWQASVDRHATIRMDKVRALGLRFRDLAPWRHTTRRIA